MQTFNTSKLVKIGQNWSKLVKIVTISLLANTLLSGQAQSPLLYCKAPSCGLPSTGEPTLCEASSDFRSDWFIYSPTGSVTVSSIIAQHPLPWQNVDIKLNSNLIVDVNTTFNNCRVSVGDNVGIIVSNGYDLTIGYSKFFDCNRRWDGIRVHYANTAANGISNITIKNSHFEDAENAFVFDAGVAVQLFKSNYLNRNRVGIRNGNTSTGVSGLNIIKFWANKFNCTTSLNPPSYGDNQYPILEPYAAILLDNTSAVLGPVSQLPYNRFEGFEIPIRSNSSTLSIVRADFLGRNCSDFYGAGIRAYKGSLFVANGNTPSYGGCKFERYISGIEGEGTWLEVQHSLFTNHDGSIASFNNDAGQQVYIRKNTFTQNTSSPTALGIYIERSSGSPTASIPAHNIIASNVFNIETYSIFNRDGMVAISKYFAKDAMRIDSNQFNITCDLPVTASIIVSGGYPYVQPYAYKMSHNNIKFTSSYNGNQRWGFWLLNSHTGINHLVAHNTISNNLSNSTLTDNAFYGILTKSFRNTTYCDNRLNNTNFGMVFIGSCSNSILQNNVMNYHSTGLRLANYLNDNGGVIESGVIGNQTRHGNLWLDPDYDYPEFAAKSTVSNASYSKFRTENASPYTLPTDISGPLYWFTQQPGANNYCQPGGHAPDVVALDNMEQDIVAGLYQDSTESDAVKWDNLRTIMQKLARTNLVLGSPEYIFYTDHIGRNEGVFATLLNSMEDATLVPEYIQSILDSIHQIRYQTIDQIRAFDTQYIIDDSTDLTPTQVEERQAYLTKLYDLDQVTQTVVNAFRDDKTTVLRDLLDVCHNIVSTTVYEVSLQQTIRIYIQQLLEMPWTSDDITELQNIATLEQQEGGSAVRGAQQLLPMCKRRSDTQNQNLTQYEREIEYAQELANSKGTQGYLIAPNPARDVIEIQVPTKSQGTWMLLNSVGNVVKQGTWGDSQHLNIDVHELPQGLYLMSLQAEKQRRVTHKVQIIR